MYVHPQVRELAADRGIPDGGELSTMLELYHDLGTIIYYGGGSSSNDNLLRNTVILSPQWLVDMLKHVVSPDWKPPDKVGTQFM